MMFPYMTPIEEPAHAVSRTRQAELEAEVPDDEEWEMSPLKEDATARRVRRLLGWGEE